MKRLRANYTVGAPLSEEAQTIAMSGASGAHATQVTGWGTTIITSTGSGAGWSARVQNAPRAGVRKTIIADIRSTAPVTLYSFTTGVLISGTTNNAITLSTGNQVRVVTLYAPSTSAWHLVSAMPSTAAALAASTSPF